MDNNAKQEAIKHMSPQEAELFLLTDRILKLEKFSKFAEYRLEELQEALSVFLTREEFNTYREKARNDFAFKNEETKISLWSKLFKN
jgi:hypothetical protein